MDILLTIAPDQWLITSSKSSLIFFEFTFIYKNDTDKFISANPINLSIASKTLLHAFRRTVDQVILVGSSIQTAGQFIDFCLVNLYIHINNSHCCQRKINPDDQQRNGITFRIGRIGAGNSHRIISCDIKRTAIIFTIDLIDTSEYFTFLITLFCYADIIQFFPDIRRICRSINLSGLFICFRIRIDNIGHCLGTHNIVLFQRSYHILLVLFILLNHVDYTIQQYL